MTRPIFHVALLVTAMLGLMPGEGLGQQTEISSAVASLRQVLASTKLGDQEKAAFAGQIKRAEEAVDSGHLYLALHRLQNTWARLGAHAFMESKAEVAKKGNDAFEIEWRRLGTELAASEKRLAARPPALAITKSLVQSSRLQSRPYYQSGRLFGLNTTPDQGFYYVGIARSSLDFALFCNQLSFSKPARGLKLRPITGELGELETETLTAYEKSVPEDQPRYNNLNSTLKLAGELDRERWAEGALLKYLEARLLLGMLTAKTPDAGRVAALEAAIKTATAQLGDGRDHSIALMFLEMARAAILPATGEADANGLKQAAVILEQVLPHYFKATSNSL
ncbi:MAG TPA: hypothetical protein VJQ56_06860 [Blastocatellia bacterium]|nr:hypothetical protein [Blastocatellia bacterium]